MWVKGECARGALAARGSTRRGGGGGAGGGLRRVSGGHTGRSHPGGELHP